jgi:ribosomal protein L11 methyltransferase
MIWLEVSVTTDGEAAEAVAELLRPYAYSDGVVLEQLGDEADLSPDALEPHVTVKIYIPEEQDSPALRRRLEESLYHLGRLYPVPPPVFRELQEEDWANAWKAHYKPFRIGRRLWIQPSWLDALPEPVEGAFPEPVEGAFPEPVEGGLRQAQPPFPPEPAAADEPDRRQPDDIVLTLDPGMAFGTGLHPTTQMCLQFLEELVEPGMRVLDVGTGSGILAIAAARLGATAVYAIDNDPIAVRTTAENVALNGVGDQVTAVVGELAAVSEKGYDIVVVNILAPVIQALLAEHDLLGFVRPGGWLLLSGIIDQQAEGVEKSVTAVDGRMARKLTIRDWVTYGVKRGM